MEPLVLKALKPGSGDATKLRAAWMYAQESADGGHYIGALKVPGRIGPMLKNDSSTDAPEDIANTKQQQWEATRSRTRIT